MSEPWSDLIIPKDIQPISGTKIKILHLGRKATRLKVLKFSPYKNRVTESLRLTKTCDVNAASVSVLIGVKGLLSSSSFGNEEFVESDSTEIDENE